MKSLKQIFEFLVLFIAFFLLKFLPIKFVSQLGGFIFQIFGPMTKAHEVAIINYKRVFKNSSNYQTKKNILKSWNNIGKTFIEFSILNTLLNSYNNKIDILGIENIEKIKKSKEQVIFFGIHQANWELIVPTIDKLGINVGAIYRHINNPYINKYILEKRKKTLSSNFTFYTPKGKESAKDILKTINSKLSMVVLIDQKDSAGSFIKFFNYEVKTQLGFLKIARKYNLKLVPIQTKRENVNDFSITFHPPINIIQKNTSDEQAMTEIHAIIEKWIIKNPTQWFWQHSRFN